MKYYTDSSKVLLERNPIFIVLCPHLAKLESAIIQAGIHESWRGKAWSQNCREWVYFDCYIDLQAVRSRMDLPLCIQDHEHRGTHDGSEHGFICTECNDGIMGRIEPREGLPVFSGFCKS